MKTCCHCKSWIWSLHYYSDRIENKKYYFHCKCYMQLHPPNPKKEQHVPEECVELFKV